MVYCARKIRKNIIKKQHESKNDHNNRYTNQKNENNSKRDGEGSAMDEPLNDRYVKRLTIFQFHRFEELILDLVTHQNYQIQLWYYGSVLRALQYSLNLLQM